MAYTELTKETAFAEITGVTSKDLATTDKSATIIEMGSLLAEYTRAIEHQNTHNVDHTTRNSGQDR